MTQLTPFIMNQHGFRMFSIFPLFSIVFLLGTDLGIPTPTRGGWYSMSFATSPSS
jgi:hypothetical protein